MKRSAGAFLAIALVAQPAAAPAQDLARLLVDLLATGVVSDHGTNNRVLPPGVDPNHEGHFLITESSPLIFLNAALFNQAVATQLSSFPLGSASGGFTYSFDPETGTFSRTSDSFGSTFTERAVTQGKGKFSVGLNYQHSRYDSFEGKSLDGGELKFYLEHNNCCPGGADREVPTGEATPELAPFFEGDVVESALSIDLTTDTTLLFVNYGVSDRIDLALILPFTRVDLNATNRATINRLSTDAFPEVHLFEGSNSSQREFSTGGSASGLGDIALRAKWNFLRSGDAALAAGLEVRLPTGNEMDLLGSGAAQGKLSIIGSKFFRKFGIHGNAGYRISGSGLERQIAITDIDRQTNQESTRVIDLDADPTASQVNLNPDEFSYAIGIDVAAAARVTVTGDLFGRVLFDAGRLTDESGEFRFRPGSNQAPISSTQFPELDLAARNLYQTFGTLGLKVNLTNTLLLSASGVFALTDAGLKDSFTPLIGLDYTF